MLWLLKCIEIACERGHARNCRSGTHLGLCPEHFWHDQRAQASVGSSPQLLGTGEAGRSSSSSEHPILGREKPTKERTVGEQPAFPGGVDTISFSFCLRQMLNFHNLNLTALERWFRMFLSEALTVEREWKREEEQGTKLSWNEGGRCYGIFLKVYIKKFLGMYADGNV